MKEIKNNSYLKSNKLAKVAPLVLVPYLSNLNKQIEKVNSSNYRGINSLIEHNIQQKETLEDNKKGYKHRSQKSIDQNNKIIHYLQDNNLSDKIQKILSIKNNNVSFFNSSNNKSINLTSTYYLEDILKLIILNIKDNNKKNMANNLLKKLNILKKSIRNKNKTPILSSYLNQMISLFITNITESTQSSVIQNNNLEINKVKYNKDLIEYNFKVKYVNPIEEYKDRNSLLYKNLPVEDKKLINTLLFIESCSKGKELNNKILLMTKQNLIKTITPFNSEFLYSKNIMFHFNKRNNYNILKNEKNIFSILEGSFLSMDSLISKAIFTIKPNNILINLFFFWKPLINKDSSNNFYSTQFSKFAVIYEKNLKNLSLILSKLLKKTVNFQFTRLYYPYNDSNIFACFIGSMSFFIKFTIMSKYFLNKINFFITKRRYYRLKYRYIPSVVNGINVKLAGRILSVRTKRKVQSKKIQWGSLARTNNTLKSISRFTNKNRTGAFSITVKNNTVIFK